MNGKIASSVAFGLLFIVFKGPKIWEEIKPTPPLNFTAGPAQKNHLPISFQTGSSNQPRRERIHPDLYKFYMEAYNAPPEEKAKILLVAVVAKDNPNVPDELFQIWMIGVQGVEDSSNGTPVRYERGNY
jgi:hypothetical protein